MPSFFLLIDKAENVNSRFKAIAFALAGQGAAFPVWSILSIFIPSRNIITQSVELPEAGHFFPVSRNTKRPAACLHAQDRRLMTTLDCARSREES